MSSAPSYSSEPGPDERRLGMAAQGAGSSTGSFSTLVKRASGITIALYNQQEHARCATYGRGASITGEISLSSVQGVTSVQITVSILALQLLVMKVTLSSSQLEGRVEMSLDSMTMPYPKVLSLCSTLWDSTRMSTCPSTIPFDIVIPESFVEPKTGTTYPLPPSYDTALALSNMHILCAYHLDIVAIRRRWVPNRALTVDVNYVPRNLPARALMDAPFPFFETVKSAPEEWRQMGGTLSSQTDSAVDSVYYDLFTPSIRVFTKHDRVPFFLQLRGTSASVMALYGSESQRREGGWTQRLRRAEQDAQTAPRITVSIQRQVLVGASDAVRVARSCTVGTGSLRPVPPGYRPAGAGEDVFTVDYEGEIHFIPSLSVGSFDVGVLRVSDFIVLSIKPSDRLEGHFTSVSQAEGVRIVTG